MIVDINLFSFSFALDGNSVIVPGLFSDSKLEAVREAAYKVFLCPEEMQEERLSTLLKDRHEMASLCGFKTYSHRYANQNVYKNKPNL